VRLTCVFQGQVLRLCAGATFCLCGAVLAAGPTSPAQLRYQQERAACLSGTSNQDRATCLKEAGAARQEAGRGGLENGGERTFTRNQMQRCDALPQTERQDCALRMQGQGQTSGSAQQGGILREVTRPVAAP
jgi:hypothetical protein